MSKHSLVLTLGHNSSAIAIRDGVILGGYETERFTKKKSDSAFPYAPIHELIGLYNLGEDTNVYIGHWFLDGQLPSNSNKYINYEYIGSTFPHGRICSLDQEFTHHDSHLLSAQVFAGHDFVQDYHAIVMDGFGSFGECISVYKVTGHSYRLLNRWFGFDKSLGMFYQYTTAYMGMKQHNHEYKILAYEVYVENYVTRQAIINYANEYAAKQVKTLLSGKMNSTYDPYLSVDALPEYMLHVSNVLDKFCDEMNVDKNNELSFRSQVSLFVQTYVQAVVITLIQSYNPVNLLLSGGLFLNVKLNNLIQKEIPGKLCVMPLSGDQGAGLGVYQRYKGDLTWPGHVNWGHRDLDFKSDVDGILSFKTMDEAKSTIESELGRIGFVNVVRGSMEFGPRALCNTSTLALANNKEICMSINKANGRTTEMPMAPVMSDKTASCLFSDCDKIHGSLEYMVIARDYKLGYGSTYEGASHYYVDNHTYTGRPQVTYDSDIISLLDFRLSGGVLINTSFNYHGVPIVMDKYQIEYSHEKQRKNSPDLGITTVVISGE